MALTAEVKDELARIEVVKKSLRNAELATILRFAGGLHIVSGRIVVEAELDNSQIARRVSKDLAELYGIKSELSVMSAGGIRKGSRYIIRVTEQGEVLARQTGLLDTRGRPVRGLPAALVAGSIEEAQAIWRGAFWPMVHLPIRVDQPPSKSLHRAMKPQWLLSALRVG